MNYVKKEDKNYLSNLEVDFNLDLKKIADEKGYDEAISYFCEMKPEKVITHFSSISSNLKKYCASKVKKLNQKYPLESFSYPSDLLNWLSKKKIQKLSF